MTDFETYSLLLQGVTVIAAGTFAIWQICINKRLIKLNDFVALSILPEGANIKLVNTGKINLYIHGFEINNIPDFFDKGRLISVSNFSDFYWLPNDNIPEDGLFDIKVYIIDEYGEKYITLGQGSSTKRNNDQIEVRVWTLKTQKDKWNFPVSS